MKLFHTREFGGHQSETSVAVAIRDIVEVGPMQKTEVACGDGGTYVLKLFRIKTGRGEHSCYPDPIDDRVTPGTELVAAMWDSAEESRRRLLESMAQEGEAS